MRFLPVRSDALVTITWTIFVKWLQTTSGGAFFFKSEHLACWSVVAICSRWWSILINTFNLDIACGTKWRLVSGSNKRKTKIVYGELCLSSLCASRMNNYGAAFSKPSANRQKGGCNQPWVRVAVEAKNVCAGLRKFRKSFRAENGQRAKALKLNIWPDKKRHRCAAILAGASGIDLWMRWTKLILRSLLALLDASEYPILAHSAKSFREHVFSAVTVVRVCVCVCCRRIN